MEIVNKVEKSGLINLDLADFYVPGVRSAIDIKDFLWQGVILKEKEFRQALADHDWMQYQNHFVAIFSSEDAIIANWAFMNIASKLQGIAKKTVFGNTEYLENFLFEEKINQLDPNDYLDKRVLVKGCGSTPIPTSAYVKITEVLQPVVKSLMYGEACSSVPVFKAKRS